MKRKKRKVTKLAKKRASHQGRIFPLLLMIPLACLFVFSACMVWQQALQLQKERQAFQQLVLLMDEEGLHRPAEIRNENENGNSHSRNYSILKEKNKDFAGWLSIPGTVIDYPVMLTPENPEYYIRRAFDQSSSQSGTPFIGADGTPDSDCFLIHAHNMRNGTMFGTLDEYTKESYWKKHPGFTFSTPEETKQYEIFAAVKTRIQDTEEAEVQYYNCSGDLSAEQYRALLDWLAEESLYDTGIVPQIGEQIVILSTCVYHADDGRFLVAAREFSE